MRITLEVWRQRRADEPGRFETYRMKDVSPDMSSSRCSTS
jgi:hypothetical protein